MVQIIVTLLLVIYWLKYTEKKFYTKTIFCVALFGGYAVVLFLSLLFVPKFIKGKETIKYNIKAFYGTEFVSERCSADSRDYFVIDESSIEHEIGDYKIVTRDNIESSYIEYKIIDNSCFSTLVKVLLFPVNQIVDKTGFNRANTAIISVPKEN